MGRAQRLYHLGDLLHAVLPYRADQQAEFDKLLETRTVEILRRSHNLTPEQKRLIDDNLLAGHPLAELRRGDHLAAKADVAQRDRNPRLADAMLAALNENRIRRRWERAQWIRHLAKMADNLRIDALRCKTSEVPAPAAIVRLYDRNRIILAIAQARTKAQREISTECDLEIEDGDEIVVSIFDFVRHEVLKRAPTGVEVTLADLGFNAARESRKEVERPNPTTQFITDLDNKGLAEQLLATCWDRYPAESKAIGLPQVGADGRIKFQTRKRAQIVSVHGRKPVSKSTAARRSEWIARWKRAKPTGIAKKDFCKDAGILVGELDKALDWHLTRKRRLREKGSDKSRQS